MRAILLSGAIALLFSLLGTRFAIVQFTKLGYGQEIREDGPTTHRTKRGTPTMGGVAIVISVVVGYFAAKLLTGDAPSATAYLLLFLLVGMAAVGFVDDFIKVFMQRNLGLRAWSKMVGQTLVAVGFGAVAIHPGWPTPTASRRRPTSSPSSVTSVHTSSAATGSSTGSVAPSCW